MKVVGIAYPTPVVRYDPLAQVVIVQHRNTSTGEVAYQVPSVTEVRSEEQAALAAFPVKPPAAAPASSESAPAATGASEGNVPPPEGEGEAVDGHVSLLA